MKSTGYDGANPFKFDRLRRRRTGKEIVSSPTTYAVDSEENHSSSHPDPEAGHGATEDEKEEEPQMSVAVAIGLLVSITVVSSKVFVLVSP